MLITNFYGDIIAGTESCDDPNCTNCTPGCGCVTCATTCACPCTCLPCCNNFAAVKDSVDATLLTIDHEANYINQAPADMNVQDVVNVLLL